MGGRVGPVVWLTGGWHRIVSALAERVAPQDTPQAHQHASQDPMALDCLNHISRTRGLETARWRKSTRDRALVGTHETDRGAPRSSPRRAEQSHPLFSAGETSASATSLASSLRTDQQLAVAAEHAATGTSRSSGWSTIRLPYTPRVRLLTPVRVPTPASSAAFDEQTTSHPIWTPQPRHFDKTYTLIRPARDYFVDISLAAQRREFADRIASLVFTQRALRVLCGAGLLQYVAPLWLPCAHGTRAFWLSTFSSVDRSSSSLCLVACSQASIGEKRPFCGRVLREGILYHKASHHASSRDGGPGELRWGRKSCPAYSHVPRNPSPQKTGS